jgi:hypothetical protein
MILIFQPARQAATVHKIKYQTGHEHNTFNTNHWQLPIGGRETRRTRPTNFDQGRTF